MKNAKKTQPTVSALELARQILDRDGIRPLLGKAFNQTEIEQLDAALRQASEDKNTFNVAVQTRRLELVGLIKQPLYLSPKEAQSLATDLIEMQIEANHWKEKWQMRKDTCDGAKLTIGAVIEQLQNAQKTLN